MMPNLPPNWSWVKLGDVCKVKGGFAFKSTAYKKEGVPLVRISNITDKKVSLEECIYVDPSFENKAKEFLLQKGDILIALSGATTGKYGIYNLEEKAFLNQRIGRLHFNGSDKIIPTFIYLYLEIIRAEILKTAYGAAQPNISPTEIADFPLPLPPLPEQKKIVEKIEELFSGLDSGVASLKKAKEQLRLYRQSVLASAFSGKLTQDVKREMSNDNNAYLNGVQGVAKAAEPKVEYSNQLPDGWKWVNIRDISDDMMIGIVKSSKDQFNNGRGVPYIKMNNVSMEGTVDTIDVVNVEVTKDELEKFSLKKGDILFNTRNSYELVGKTGIVKEERIKRVFNNNLLRIRTRSEFNPDFINYQMNSHDFKEKLKQGKRATTNICAIYQKDLFPMALKIPPLVEQTQIVEEIEKRFSEADNLEKAIDDSLAKSEILRQSILSRAFSGKLV